MPPIKGSSRQANRACSGWLNWAIHSTTSTGSCHSAILGSPAYDSVRQKPLSWQESLCARSQPGREIANVGFFRKCSWEYNLGGLALDSTGKAYITGPAGPGLPTTSGAFQTTVAGSDG